MLPLLVERTEALRASSLTGRDLTRRTRGTATRGHLTGTTRGTGDTLPQYSNNLKRERQVGRDRKDRGEKRRRGRTEKEQRNKEKVKKEENQVKCWDRKRGVKCGGMVGSEWGGHSTVT